MLQTRFRPSGWAELSPEARDVIERVRGGEALTFDDQPRAVAREVRVYRHRLHVEVDIDPFIHGDERPALLGPDWPYRHVRTIREAKFTLDSLLGEQRAVYERALGVLQPANGSPGTVGLCGLRGLGKTLLATLIAWNLEASRAQPGQPSGARYWSAGDLVSEQKRWFGTRDGVAPLTAAREASLLVLDEVQEQVPTNWDRAELTRLLDFRYRQCQPTLLITNLEPQGLAKRLGDSVTSRLQESGTLIECQWASQRRRA